MRISNGAVATFFGGDRFWQRRRSFLLASAVALTPAVAHSQTAPDPLPAATSAPSADDDIVVTGVRAAIRAGLDAKRNASSIIDSISAEDIGKFPDNNIAEAVQRIPGVSIDRSGGEGRYISINGLGPDFSLTLVNGRQIASSDPGRSFSFDTIASDLVHQVNVYKSANADVPEGGLGGTIDVRTARPFDFKGLTATAQLAYQYEENSKEGFPQGSFVISDTFLNGKLGLLFSYTHQKRHGRSYQTTADGWTRNYFVDPATQAYVDDQHADAWRVWDLQYGTTDTYRTRDGGTAALQFAPSDKLTITADYLYSKFSVKNVTNSGGAYLWAVQDSPKTVIDSTGSYHQLDVSGGYNLGSFSFNNSTTYRPTTTQLAGLNVEWKPTDRLKAVIDGYWSKAITNNSGLNTSQTLEMLNQPGYMVYFPDKGVPYFDLLGRNLANAQDQLRARLVSNSGTYTRAENKGVTADFTYEPWNDIKVRFGGSYAVQEKGDTYYLTPEAVSRLYQKNAEGQQIDTASIISGIMTADSRFGLTNGTFPVFLIDADALRKWMADPVNLANRTKNATAGGLQDFIANGRSWTAQRTNDSFLIRERDLGLYAEVDASFDLGRVPVSVVAGGRYSRTQLRSTGTSRVLVGFTVDNFHLLPNYAANGYTPADVSNTYERFLPSINMKFSLTDRLIYRVGVSQTLSRPTLEDLSPTISYGGLSVSQRTATGYNPFLKPSVSTNVDASLEYYYSRNGALSVAGFHKDARDFIVRTPAQEKITTIASVPAELAGIITLDQLQTFRVDRPRNAASAVIDGLTASWTHTLPLGLGAQVNYTKVWSSTTANGVAFQVPGISDTANVIAFFERGPLAARVAFNWRSSFLVSAGLPTVSEPIYSAAYHQIDGRIGIDLGSGVNLGIEGVNLTNEKVRSRAAYDNQFISVYSYGRQLRATVSKKF